MTGRNRTRVWVKADTYGEIVEIIVGPNVILDEPQTFVRIDHDPLCHMIQGVDGKLFRIKRGRHRKSKCHIELKPTHEIRNGQLRQKKLRGRSYG